MTHKLFILICTTMMLHQAAHANTSPLLKNDSLDNYITKALVSWKIPGAAVFIVKDGEVILEKGYGTGNRATGRKVDIHTLFPIASVTKTFTGTMFATLEADGIINLSDHVKKWLPQFSMSDNLYEQQLMLADILSHRSGWKTFQGDLLNTESSLTFSEMIGKFCLQQPAYPIRTRFGYSNFGFMIAGECTNMITGQNWNNYLKSRFLIPLEMHRTMVFNDEIRLDTNKVAGHTLHNDTIKVLPPDKIEPYSHGGLFSSIHDQGTWACVLLNKGNYKGKQLIPANAVDKMWQSFTIIGKSRAADRQRYFKTYGLGWEIMQYNNLEVIGHNGAYSGALSSFTLVPAIGLGIVILTNHDNHVFQETLKWQVIDAFLQKEAPDYSMEAIEWQNKRKAENKIQQNDANKEPESFYTPLGNITGTYSCKTYGKAFIRKTNNNYVLKLEHHPQLTGSLTPYKRDQLLCTYNHPMFGTVPFTFTIKGDTIKAFTLRVDDFIEADGYTFQRLQDP